MCIIIAKNKIGRLPTKEELTNCFENNSDGAGFMYVNSFGKVEINKGYMQINDFLNKFDELCKKYNNFENKSLVIHCRISTAGGVNPENCHPYPISKKEKYLKKLTFYTDLGVAHNGIISNYNPAIDSKINDTQNFIMRYLAPIKKNYKYFYKNNAFLEGLKYITNSKLAFLDKKEDLKLSGDFTKEADGLYFSNTTYKYSYKKYDFTKVYNYGNYYNEYFDTDSGKSYGKTEEVESDFEIVDKTGFVEVQNEKGTFDFFNLKQLETEPTTYFKYNYFTLELIEVDADGKAVAFYDDVTYFTKEEAQEFLEV